MSTESAEQVSWENARAHKPARPEIPTSLAPEERIDRPRTLRTVTILSALAAALVLVLVGVGATAFDAIRDGLLAGLPDDATAGYTEEQISRAATLITRGTGVIAVLLTLPPAFALSAMLRRRSSAGRVVFAITGAVLIAGLTFAAALLSGDMPAQQGATTWLLLGVVAALVITAIALSTLPRVSQWLRQTEERRSIQISDATR